jgi:hypothetical protein
MIENYFQYIPNLGTAIFFACAFALITFGTIVQSIRSRTLKGLEVTNRRFYVTDIELGVICTMGKFTPYPDMSKGAMLAISLALIWLMVGYFRGV